MAKNSTSARSGITAASTKGNNPVGKTPDKEDAAFPGAVVQEVGVGPAQTGWLTEFEGALELHDEQVTGPPDTVVVQAFQSLAYLLWGHLRAGQQISIEERALVEGAKHQHAIAVACHPSTPVRLLEALAKDKESCVRWSVAEHPLTPVRLLEALAKDKNAVVRCRVAKHLSTPGHLLEALAKDEDRFIRWGVAENPSTPVPDLEALAKDKDTVVRGNVAKHPLMPARQLEALAKDKDTYVRVFVAKNPSLPEPLLDALAKDKRVVVRAFTAKNPSTPPAALEFLALEPKKNYKTRLNIEAVLTNPAASAALRTKLLKQLSAGSKPSYVRVFGLRLADCPPAVLTKCAKSPLWLERCAVAQHAMSTKKLLERLMHDTHTAVSAAARWRLAQGGGVTDQRADKSAKTGAKRKAD